MLNDDRFAPAPATVMKSSYRLSTQTVFHLQQSQADNQTTLKSTSMIETNII